MIGMEGDDLRVGISTASFYNTCMLEDAPARVAALGARDAEVFLNTFSEYEPDFIRLLKTRFDEAQVSVYSVHPMGTQFEPQLFSVHPRQRDDAWKIFERVLQAGRIFGASYYVMHGPAGQFGMLKNMQLERIGPITKELCSLAKTYGLRIAWENVSWCLFNTPAFAPAIADAAKCDELRFTLDIKQAARSGYSAEAYINAMGERLANLHVCDYRLENGNMTPFLPGRGECDFHGVKEALLRHNYSGPAFLEVYSDLYEDDAVLKGAYDYIKRIFE